MTADQFATLRQQAGCTTATWSKLLGITPGTCRNIECGTQPTISPTLARLATLMAAPMVREHIWALLEQSRGTMAGLDAPYAAHRAQARLRALERQLQHYLNRPATPARTPRIARQLRLRRADAILNNLKRQRALLSTGTEVDWRHITITDADHARYLTLLNQEVPQ